MPITTSIREMSSGHADHGTYQGESPQNCSITKYIRKGTKSVLAVKRFDQNIICRIQDDDKGKVSLGVSVKNPPYMSKLFQKT